MYEYYEVNNFEDGPYPILITSVKAPNLRRNYSIIGFRYMDTWEDDEMSLEIFNKYCKLVNDV